MPPNSLQNISGTLEGPVCDTAKVSEDHPHEDLAKFG
jgi:hypothetical protein